MDVDAIINAFKAKTFVTETNKRTKVDVEDANRALKGLWWDGKYSVDLLADLNTAFRGVRDLDPYGLLGFANHFLGDGTRDGVGYWTYALQVLSLDSSFVPTDEQPFVFEVRAETLSDARGRTLTQLLERLEGLDDYERTRDILHERGLLLVPESPLMAAQQIPDDAFSEDEEEEEEDAGDGEELPPSSPSPTPGSPAEPEPPSVYPLEELIRNALKVIDRTTGTINITAAREELTQGHHSPFLHAHDFLFRNQHEGGESSAIKSPFTLYYEPAYSFGYEAWDAISYANRNGDLAAAYRAMVLKAILFGAGEAKNASPAGAAERAVSVFVDPRTDAVLDLVTRVHAAILEIGSDLTEATAIDRFAKLESFKEEHEALLADLDAQLQKFQPLVRQARGWTTDGSPLVDLLVAVANVGMKLGIARYGAGAGDLRGPYLQGNLSMFPGFQYEEAQGGAGPP